MNKLLTEQNLAKDPLLFQQSLINSLSKLEELKDSINLEMATGFINRLSKLASIYAKYQPKLISAPVDLYIAQKTHAKFPSLMVDPKDWESIGLKNFNVIKIDAEHKNIMDRLP